MAEQRMRTIGSFILFGFILIAISKMRRKMAFYHYQQFGKDDRNLVKWAAICSCALPLPLPLPVWNMIHFNGVHCLGIKVAIESIRLHCIRNGDGGTNYYAGI